ncbi:HisA/HisF-related TIM barrel protein [Parablautia muri]|uniref:Phosphoribosylformimino-5-aminoimidazole carboxamide ribotide isomerase n=1 Tax=Parablautia muri TaxID=2320879 RepID=A0A9X5BJI0_9FIRM|nr:HisA/HisF-related TIM barrel protein [Parablautia muri]NBJ94911.1 phosphoribosylformimino-5-aminoimidazole carboxamide ribotide isomerase [Parablautia muri]
MKFRPCIDIHNGKVKQIVGGSLQDQGNKALENFVSLQDAAFFARLYEEKGLKGGHIILLNPPGSEYYEKTREQAMKALKAYPGGLQVGGGITPDRAEDFLAAGASHVIVTSYIFRDGKLHYDRLREMVAAVGKERLVLDLSCRRMGWCLEKEYDPNKGCSPENNNFQESSQDYYIVTDRWQNYTNMKLNADTLEELSDCCGEFLIHAVDVEGKAQGIEQELVALLGKECQIPTTYAGGVHNFEDLEKLKTLGRGRIDVTIGSALDLFGGKLKLEDVLAYIK